MKEFKVRKEKCAERCEICHKADHFNPISNYCFRCCELQTTQLILIKNIEPTLDPFGRSLILQQIELQASLQEKTNRSGEYNPINMLAFLQEKTDRSREYNPINILTLLALSLTIIAGYIAYVAVPIFYKEQLLKNKVKEGIRVSVCNGRHCDEMLKRECKKIVQEIGFPTDITVTVSIKHDNPSIKCYGDVPMDFLFFTFNYHVYVAFTADRGGY